MGNLEIDRKIQTIEKMKQQGVFKNYIEYIDFPFYKNLVPRTRINFIFPITLLVGKNGSGKSSTLHALYGAPLNKTCADYWFSTEVDRPHGQKKCNGEWSWQFILDSWKKMNRKKRHC